MDVYVFFIKIKTNISQKVSKKVFSLAKIKKNSHMGHFFYPFAEFFPVTPIFYFIFRCPTTFCIIKREKSIFGKPYYAPTSLKGRFTQKLTPFLFAFLKLVKLNHEKEVQKRSSKVQLFRHFYFYV